MQVLCKQCEENFDVTQDDLTFYAELKIPAPVLCPACREQRRLMWRNERKLYVRKCDGTGETILSVYSPNKPFPVYKVDYWYSDAWTALSYWQEFDFNRPFFEQFAELMHKVPQVSLSVVGNQNCDYINQAGWNKDCYLVFEANYDEKCFYSHYIYNCRDCMDCTHAYKSELCYDSVDIRNCYHVKYSQNCMNCSDSAFLKNCIGCSNCFGCVNLRSKEYHIYNQAYSKEDYFRKLQEITLDLPSEVENSSKLFYDYSLQFPHKQLHGVQNENSVGDYLFNTQNCYFCFDVFESQDCKFVTNSNHVKKVYDLSVFGGLEGTEYCCDNHEVGHGVRNICYSDQIWSSCYDILYSKLCMQNCHHLFGCVGLRKASYCVLNKQYTKEEYEALLPRIVEHMKKTGEWGLFFPPEISPYAYNETLAQDYYPLSKEEALQQGFRWKEESQLNPSAQSYQGSYEIFQVPDTVTKEIFACVDCKKNFKIILQELEFYRELKLPLPTRCHDCRHEKRIKLRNPRKLWLRHCDQCQKEIQSSFAPDRPEKVYCEKCYLAVVY